MKKGFLFRISKEKDHSVNTRKWSFLSNYGYSEATPKGRLDHLVEDRKMEVETAHKKKIPRSEFFSNS